MSGKKLAQAAAQQLKGVIIEYDALCSTLIGRSTAEQLQEQRRKEAQRLEDERRAKAAADEGGLFKKMVSSMFVTDVRSMLKDLQQDSTGKPWIVKDRLESTLKGLPSEVLDRVKGEGPSVPNNKTEEEEYLSRQLAAASAETERRAAEKQEALQRKTQEAANGGGSDAVRAKYLEKLNALKAKAKTRSPDEALASFTGVAPEPSGAIKGLSTWLVNKGANEMITYATIRGLAKATTPPMSAMQAEEYEVFRKEMEAQFDSFMPDEDYRQLVESNAFTKLCDELDLKPVEVLVIAHHSNTIRAARSAGAHTCHFMKSENEIPNHSADYQLTNLAEVQYIVEEFNGISYRGRVP